MRIAPRHQLVLLALWQGLWQGGLRKDMCKLFTKYVAVRIFNDESERLRWERDAMYEQCFLKRGAEVYFSISKIVDRTPFRPPPEDDGLILQRIKMKVDRFGSLKFFWKRLHKNHH